MALGMAWLVAHLAAGFRWVWRDQQRRGADRKAYVTSRSARWATRLLWLPMSIRSIHENTSEDRSNEYVREKAAKIDLGGAG